MRVTVTILNTDATTSDSVYPNRRFLRYTRSRKEAGRRTEHRSTWHRHLERGAAARTLLLIRIRPTRRQSMDKMAESMGRK